MTAWWELPLLLMALAAAAALGWDVVRERREVRRQQRRLDQLGDRAEEEDPDADPDADQTLPGPIAGRLRGVGLETPGQRIVVAALAVLAVAVFLGVLASFPGALLMAAAAAFLAVAVPWSLLGAWARERARRFEEKLVDAVAFMASALEAGENPTRALATAAQAAEPPVAPELDRAVRRLDLGADVRRALEPIAAGYDSEGTRLFCQTLIAKWHAGGDLAPILGRVGALMRERLAMRLRLRSELAGARFAALVVSILPYLLIPVMLWRRPDWVRAFYEHPLGPRLVFVALMLQLVGILWLRRIMRIQT